MYVSISPELVARLAGPVEKEVAGAEPRSRRLGKLHLKHECWWSVTAKFCDFFPNFYWVEIINLDKIFVDSGKKLLIFTPIFSQNNIY
jgi:hypothetical protein